MAGPPESGATFRMQRQTLGAHSPNYRMPEPRSAPAPVPARDRHFQDGAVAPRSMWWRTHKIFFVMDNRRPFADRIEVGAPKLAALVARTLSVFPESIRRKALRAAFDRARDAFNRGDIEVVFALFAPDVEYRPPPPLYDGGSIRGRDAVFAFWRGILARYEENTIENLSLDEVSSGSFVRQARLHHRSIVTGESLDYSIVQTTDLRGGRVVRQVNVLSTPE